MKISTSSLLGKHLRIGPIAINIAASFIALAGIGLGVALLAYLTNPTHAGVTVDGQKNFRQSAYQFYENADSITPGDILAPNNTSAQLTDKNQPFRLRIGVEVGEANPYNIYFKKVDPGFQFKSSGNPGTPVATCAIGTDDKAYCWGSGASGATGQGYNLSTSSVRAVVATGVLANKTIVDQSTGGRTTCAVASDGAPYCWGDNWYGLLGNGASTSTTASSPVAVNRTGVLAGKTLTKIDLSSKTACAIDTLGAGYCWGNGPLGTGTSNLSMVPVAINMSGALAGKTLQSISVGGSYYDGTIACAIASDAQIYCWGYATGRSDTPTSNAIVAVDTSGVLADKTMTKVTAGENHVCALDSNGLAYCWGNNANGALGNGSSRVSSTTPVAVKMDGALAGKTLTDISAGDETTCAVASDQKVYCWGANIYGQIGDRSIIDAMEPVPTNGDGTITTKNIAKVTTATDQTCAIATTGSVDCWGYGANLNPTSYRSANNPVNGLVTPSGDLSGKTLSSTTVYYNTACSLTSDNDVACWGGGDRGSLGSNNLQSSSTARSVTETGVLAGKTIKALSHNRTSCVIANDDLPYCWGDGYYGAIGDGLTYTETTRYDSTPRAVSTSGVLAGKTVKSISTSHYNTCAIGSDDLAYCWGTYPGNGSYSNAAAPVAVTTSGVLAGKTIKAIAAGNTSSCVIASDDLPYCWGSNIYGQLGNGTTTASSVPVAVTMTGALAGKTVKKISVGDHTACVVASDDLPYCWGNGPLGNGTSTGSTTPVAVTSTGALAGLTVKSVVTATNGSCVIASNDQAYCWDTASSALGINSRQPVAFDNAGIFSGKIVSSISVGYSIAPIYAGPTFCATATDGTTYCRQDMTYNQYGLLGNGQAQRFPTMSHAYARVDSSISAVEAESNTYVLQYAVRTASSCESQTNGFSTVTATTPIAFATNPSVADRTAIADLGYNAPLGGSRNAAPQAYVSSPTPFTNNTALPGIASGGYGDNFSFNGHTALWDFSLIDNEAPLATDYCLRVAYEDGTPLETYYQAPQLTTAARPKLVDTAGRAYTAADNTSPGAPLADTGESAQLAADGQAFRIRTGVQSVSPHLLLTDISVGYDGYATCGIRTDGKGTCWGDNSDGQVGDGTTANRHTPVLLDDSGALAGKTLVAIDSGSYGGCAIASDARAYCWGVNAYGEIGDGSYNDSASPVAVDTSGVLNGKTLTDISTGDYNVCAVGSGEIFCWGDGSYGQFGDGNETNSTVPVAVTMTGAMAGKTATSVSIGHYHTCAVASGEVFCWGANWYGQLGDGSFDDSTVPVAVDTSGALSGKTIVDVTVDNYVTCAITSDGQAFCWGYGGYGQLGTGNYDDSAVPVAVNTSGALAGKNVTHITSGGQQATCAIASGEAFCWGAGWDGQLGYGGENDQPSPVAVDTSGLLAGKQVIAIATGGQDTSCAITADNYTYCWGYNGYGQFGNGTTTDSLTPVQTTQQTYNIAANTGSFQLEFARRTAGTCSLQASGFAAVTQSSPIAYTALGTTSHGTPITTLPEDPSESSPRVMQTIVSQAGAFTNLNSVTAGERALWDFSLRDNGALDATDYCVRIAHADGTPLEQYVNTLTLRTAGSTTPTQTVTLPEIPNEAKEEVDRAISEGTIVTENGFTCINIDGNSVSTLSGANIIAPPNVRILGGVAFSIFCEIEGGVARISLVLGQRFDDLNALRVYKQMGGLIDITSSVTISNRTYASEERTFITYTVADGDEFDEDGIINGTIVDPVYIGLYGIGEDGAIDEDTELAETGIGIATAALAGILLIVPAILVIIHKVFVKKKTA